MRLLLDTHTLVWAMTATKLLPASLRRMIEDGHNEVRFSAISIFEIASKRASGRRSAPMTASDTIVELAARSGLRELALTSSHARAVETIATFHPDPFDRLLLAQAQVEGLQLVTHDEALAGYDPRTILF